MKALTVWVVLLILSMLFLNVRPGWSQPKSGANAPVITHAFAVEKGRYGDVWKLYIEANDPNADMLRIAIVAYQDGFGRHRPDWVFVKGEQKNHLLGYLQWNTFSSKGGSVTEWTNVVLKVSVFDRAGNESNVVVFPHEFVSERMPKTQLPAPFDQSGIPRLGYLWIDLAPNPSKTN